MQNYNTNLSSQEVSTQSLSANQTIEVIQNISKNIRAYSIQMRQTVKIIRESGVIPEIALAIRDGSLAVRDTMKDINETTQHIRNNGLVSDTAQAVENTLKSAEQSAIIMKEITTDVGRVSPNTTKAIKDSINTVKRETSHVTERVMKDFKNKVGV